MSPITAKLAAALKQDLKKTCVLGLLTAVLAGMGVRAWLGRGPSSAAAGASSAAAASPSAATSRPPSLARVAAVLRDWRQQPAPHLSRNPFTSELLVAAVPAPPPAAPPAPVVAADGGIFWRQLERSLATRSERERFRDALTSQALADAAGLALRSVVTGSASRAMVGDRLLAAGDLVAAANGPFLVEAIDVRRVVLQRDGVRVELALGRREPRLARD